MRGAGRTDGAADALVIFGITGDLSRVTTYRSLQELGDASAVCYLEIR